MKNIIYMTKHQCYLAMYEFLVSYFFIGNKTDNDEILAFLTSLCLLPDGAFFDDATPEYFDEAMIKTHRNNAQASFSPNEGLCVIYHFLATYFEISNNKEADELIDRIRPLRDGTPTDPSILEAWNSAVTLAIEGKVDPLLRLKK